MSVEMDDYLYSNIPPESLGDWGSDYGYTTDFHETAGRQVEKILISSENIPLEGWEREYERYIPEGLYMQMSESTLLMVMNRQATKLNGIRLLAERYGVRFAAVFLRDSRLSSQNRSEAGDSTWT